MRARWLLSGSPFGVFTEPKAGTHRACAVKGLEAGQVAPHVTQHRPGAQSGEGWGRNSELLAFENRQMHPPASSERAWVCDLNLIKS